MSALEVALRPIGAFDLPVVAALHEECFDEAAWSEEALGALLATAGVDGMMILAAGEPAGFFLVRTVVDESEILSLGVRHAWRRRGMGRLLLRAALDRAVAAGGRRIHLEVGESNAAARQLYSGEGFEIVGRRPDYYSAAVRMSPDALIYGRNLP